MGPEADVRAAAWTCTVEGINAWLWGSEGRTEVRHTLDRYRLPVALADDLAQEVLYRAWRAIGAGEAGTSGPAFAVALLHQAAVDVLRGRARREVPERPGADPDLPAGVEVELEAVAGAGAESAGGDAVGDAAGAESAGGESVGDAAAPALDPPVADGLRRSLHGLLGPEPAAGAAALAYVTLVTGDVPPPSDCPAPQEGADTEERLAWAALWCTGRDDCFEAGPGEPASGQPTVRARRSQALQAMRALLARAADGLPEDDRA